MRNKFRKPKNCELRHSIFLTKTILAGHICERSEYIWPATLYELAEHHLFADRHNIFAISRQQHLSVGTVWTAVKYKCEPTNFGRGGFYIRPFQNSILPPNLADTDLGSRRNDVFIGVPFFGRALSVVPLCENFAHLCSLVFTVISHSCSYWVEAYLCSLRSHR